MLLPYPFHQPAQGGPLEGREPGDDGGGEEIVEQPPALQKSGLIDRHQDEGHPPAQTIAATEQFAQPDATHLDGFTQGGKKGGFTPGKGQAGRRHRQEDGLSQRITGYYSIHSYNGLRAEA